MSVGYERRTATESDRGKVCTYSLAPLQPGQPLAACSACGSLLLEEAWRENGGCSSMGCVNAPDFRKDETAVRVTVSPSDAASRAAGHAFQPHHASGFTDSQIEDIARLQRTFLRTLLWGFCAAVALVMVFPPASPLVTIGFCVYWVIAQYQMAQSLKLSGCLFAIAALIPLVSLVALWYVNSLATEKLRAHGLRVGLLGVSSVDLEQFLQAAERRASQ